MSSNKCSPFTVVLVALARHTRTHTGSHILSLKGMSLRTVCKGQRKLRHITPSGISPVQNVL